LFVSCAPWYEQMDVWTKPGLTSRCPKGRMMQGKFSGSVARPWPAVHQEVSFQAAQALQMEQTWKHWSRPGLDRLPLKMHCLTVPEISLSHPAAIWTLLQVCTFDECAYCKGTLEAHVILHLCAQMHAQVHALQPRASELSEANIGKAWRIPFCSHLTVSNCFEILLCHTEP